LGYFDIDGKVIVVGSYAGADINPAWVHNLRAHPHTQIEIGSETVEVDARELPEGEREAVWAQIATMAPPFAKYQTQTTRAGNRVTWCESWSAAPRQHPLPGKPVGRDAGQDVGGRPANSDGVSEQQRWHW
jgi:deazaflavin-dependent oxidoreductase (nitroreductase family)